MSSALIVRIIGGLCGGAIGTYISVQIYDYLNRNRQPITQKPFALPEKYELKFKDVKSFEEILNIQVNEYINNQNGKNDYEYDNEQGNTFNIKLEVTEDT